MAEWNVKPGLAETRSAAERARHVRIGLVLFAIYTALYAAFMLVNAFTPQVMETIVFGGINWAVFSGMALIVGAFLLSLVYLWLCRSSLEGRP